MRATRRPPVKKSGRAGGTRGFPSCWARRTSHADHFRAIFALGANGRIVCLDGKVGREKWAVETLADNANVQWAMSGSPLVVDNLVIVNPGAQTEGAKGKAVRAYDRTTGNEVWAAGNQRAGYCSPQLATLDGKKQVLIFDAAGLAGHDLANGTELWRFSYPTFQGINAAQPIAIDESNIVFAAGYNVGGARIKVTESDGKWTATEVWRTKNTVMWWKFAVSFDAPTRTAITPTV